MILCVCPNPSIDTYVTVDDLSPGQVHRAASEERFPGGKGVHVALACAELGADVTLLGFWAGPTGQWIREECQRLGVRCTGPEIPGWSRSCITFKSSGEYDETELLGCGPQVAAEHVDEFHGIFKELLADPQAAVATFSGSWPPGAPAGAYARLLKTAHAAGTATLVDFTGKEMEQSLALRPDVVHLNRGEAAAFTGSVNYGVSTRMLARQAKLAVVTAGDEGAFFCAGGQMIHAACRITPQYSAVGSGDCLLAGLAVAQERRASLEDAARLATACGAANCLRRELGMLHRRDVDALLPQVSLREVR